MNSYAIAIGVPGLLVLLAVLLWCRPTIRRRRQVRRVRKDLAHVDLMAAAWSQSVTDFRPFDDPPSSRHHRRRHRHPEGDGPA